jgi:Phage protein (N4 Gp49/phage Sf6 gene 66) family
MNKKPLGFIPAEYTIPGVLASLQTGSRVWAPAQDPTTAPGVTGGETLGDIIRHHMGEQHAKEAQLKFDQHKQTIEQRDALKAVKVTELDALGLIASCEYYSPAVTNGRTTIATATLQNGYTVVGQSHASQATEPVKETGEKRALADVVHQIIRLETYMLQETIHRLNVILGEAK